MSFGNSVNAFMAMVLRNLFRPRKLVIPIIALTLIYIILAIRINQLQNTLYDVQPVSDFEPSNSGQINIEIWHGLCSLNFNSLRQYALFPWQPTERQNLLVGATLSISNDGKHSFGLRAQGYLYPPLTGLYSFHLQTHSMAQVWLAAGSAANSPSNVSKIAYTTNNIIGKRRFRVGNSKSIFHNVFLHHGRRYYFEILIAVNDKLPKEQETTNLLWTLPGETIFTNISGKHVLNMSRLYSIHDDYQKTHPGHVVATSPSLQFSEEEDQLTGPFFPLDKNTTTNKRVKLNLAKTKALLKYDSYRFTHKQKYSLPYFERDRLDAAFSKCTYEPSYMAKRKYGRYQAVWKIRYALVYPYDGSWNVRWGASYKAQFKVDDRFDGAIFIKDEEAVWVVQNFMKTLNDTYPGEFKLADLINIEKVSDSKNGDRYFLELLLHHHHSNKFYRLSEFFYLKLKQPNLCILENLRWNSKAWVNVILNVKHQQSWVVNFISEMARILTVSRDQYVNFIIADYGNGGIDIGQEMKRQGIKNYKIIKPRSVTFHKTSSINMAASQVGHNNSIVLLMDLHLRFPLNFFEKIRQHTIQGKLAFSPIVFRLDRCGRPQTKHLTPSGFWESLGFGIFSIYKSDWDTFGGMNEKEFKNKWGGEDWEMVDRVMSQGIEIDKLRTIGFYHFYHDKKGLWNM